MPQEENVDSEASWWALWRFYGVNLGAERVGGTGGEYTTGPTSAARVNGNGSGVGGSMGGTVDRGWRVCIWGVGWLPGVKPTLLVDRFGAGVVRHVRVVPLWVPFTLSINLLILLMGTGRVFIPVVHIFVNYLLIQENI